VLIHAKKLQQGKLRTYMEQKKLIEILKKMLKTERSLDFLSQIKKDDLENLIALIRDRLENDSQ